MPYPTSSGASDVWSLKENYKAEAGSNWPEMQTGINFSISPSFNGKSTWNTDADGTLNIGATGSALPSYEYIIVPSNDMTATVKMWGAGGARGYQLNAVPPSSNYNTDGGGGGYTTATMIFRANTTYVLRIGEGGIVDILTSVGSGATYLAGGIGSTGPYGGTEGGGYSGIFEGSATFGNARLIAGGGGGGGDSQYTQGGGAGGGSTGQSGGGALQSGGGGTQSSGGGASAYNNAQAGSQLTGGLAQNNTQGASMGGGGGGYFGGGGGNVGGGGGGSGFVSTNADITNGSTSTGNYGTPANDSDTDRNNAGSGGSSTIGQTYGSDGRIILEFV